MSVEKLIESSGAVVECPCCGGLNAHAWCDVDEERGVAHVVTVTPT